MIEELLARAVALFAREAAAGNEIAAERWLCVAFGLAQFARERALDAA
jgi:hypothetical protein